MNSKKSTRYILYIILIFFQISVCALIFQYKGHFDIDEIYTYGLANCEEYPFLSKDAATTYGNRGWMNYDFFLHYVTYDNTKPFSFDIPYKNQAIDVHPPLYYYLIHIICFFYGSHFSYWSGLIINFIILIILDYFLFKVGMYLLNENRIASILCIFFWTFSSSGLSNIIFIRMYLMLTLMLILFLYFHVNIFQSKIFFTMKELISVYVVIILGGLTHYYFYPFVFFFSFPICIYLLLKKKWMSFLKYVIALVGGFCTNILYFPATMDHVFNRNRGMEVIGNVVYGFRKENVFLQYYLGAINDSLFGGFLFLFLMMTVVFIIVWSVKNRKHISSYFRSLDFYKCFYISILCIAMIGYAYIAIHGSFFVRNRYIFPLYAIGAILVVKILLHIMQFVFRKPQLQYILIGVLVLLFVSFSIKRAGIATLLPLSDETQAKIDFVKGIDCLVYQNVNWFEINSSVPFCMQNDETFLLDHSEMDHLDEILRNRETYDNVIVWIPASLSQEKAEKILKEIVSNTDYTDYKYVFSDLMHVYELKKKGDTD